MISDSTKALHNIIVWSGDEDSEHNYTAIVHANNASDKWLGSSTYMVAVEVAPEADINKYSLILCKTKAINENKIKLEKTFITMTPYKQKKNC